MSGMDRLTELLPCPFCGDNHATTTYTRDGRLVVCTSCGAKSGNYYHGPKHLPSADERAIAAWNLRASQAAPAPSDGLREAVPLGLVEALRSGRQADMDGVMVTVSRQACEMASDILAALSASPAQEGGE